MEYFRNVALVSFCFAYARCLVLCSSYSYLLSNQMPTWTNLINGYGLLIFFFFPPLLCTSVLSLWMEFNYYSIYYFGSFYRTINRHICIINIDITLMFYNVQYVKTISVRNHPLLLVSKIFCLFNVKKFAAQACLLPWFQKINGGKCSALGLMCWAGWIRLLSSNSCMCHLFSSVLSISPSKYSLSHLLELVDTWDHLLKRISSEHSTTGLRFHL